MAVAMAESPNALGFHSRFRRAGGAFYTDAQRQFVQKLNVDNIFMTISPVICNRRY
jgi:hypothetical protein